MAARSGQTRIQMYVPKTMAMPNTVKHHADRRHHLHCQIPAISNAQYITILFAFLNLSTCRQIVTFYPSFSIGHRSSPAMFYRYTGVTVRKCFVLSLSPTSLSQFPHFRRESWHSGIPHLPPLVPSTPVATTGYEACY